MQFMEMIEQAELGYRMRRSSWGGWRAYVYYRSSGTSALCWVDGEKPEENYTPSMMEYHASDWETVRFPSSPGEGAFVGYMMGEGMPAHEARIRWNGLSPEMTETWEQVAITELARLKGQGREKPPIQKNQEKSQNFE